MSWIFSEQNWTEFRNWRKRVIKFMLLSGVGALIIYYIFSSIWLSITLNGEQRGYLKQYAHASWYSSSWGFYRISNSTVYIINDEEKVWEDSYAEEVFRKFMYGGESYNDLVFFPNIVSWLIFFCGTVGLMYLDSSDLKKRKEGKVLRGGRKVNCKEFIRIISEEDLVSKLLIKLGKKEKPALGVGIKVFEDEKEYFLQVKKVDEPTHFLVVGDNGTGKSQLLFQLLSQIRDRGETAIVYDPAREFLRVFYDESRGDVVLNPLDARSPFWSPSDEVTAKGEAETVAKSLFPDGWKKGDFFVEKPREIFCELMKEKPSPKDLLKYMSQPELLDAKFEGTRFAAYLDSKAAAQRNGVLSSLSNIAKSLELLPESSNKSWAAAEWSKKRKGWVFITSTPQSRDALLPLISCWFDCLVLRLMAAEPDFAKANPVWVVADELQTLERLKSLETALTESRKANVRLVIGFQGKAQIEQLYEKMAEVMLSQPSTKLFLRTTEPKAAQWISDSIGEVEIERLRRSTSEAVKDNRDSINSEMARQMERLIIPSEIMGLAKLEGYIKYSNLVVNIKFKPQDYKQVASGFISREIKEEIRQDSDRGQITNDDAEKASIHREKIEVTVSVDEENIEKSSDKNLKEVTEDNEVNVETETDIINEEEKKERKTGKKGQRKSKNNLSEDLKMKF